MIHSTYLKAMTAAILLSLGCSSWAQDLPPAIQALQKKGITFVGTFVSKTGLKAYAATAGGRSLSLYIAPGGAAFERAD